MDYLFSYSFIGTSDYRIISVVLYNSVNNTNAYRVTIEDYLFSYLFDCASDYRIIGVVLYNFGQ